MRRAKLETEAPARRKGPSVTVRPLVNRMGGPTELQQLASLFWSGIDRMVRVVDAQVPVVLGGSSV